ncbi:MAG TPA: NAD-dependent epimerase/dehydratase family protein [Stellaceae bacterium]|nr:NAD-dependent epimerase/dehydratase family protein [Stellaceae bacterium]
MGVLVTGAAGFIGFHVAMALLAQGRQVCGIDNVNDYYSVALKRARLARLAQSKEFEFNEIDISDRDAVAEVFRRHPDIDGIIHLAAQAGVRYSLVNPYAYAQSNVMGQVVMLEAARRLERLRCFVYASSSSVYGANRKQPFSVEDRVDNPISLYAATKRSCELLTESYCHLFGMPSIGLRFFTVYGPWGRPDMAAYLFADAIVAGRPIQVFNYGKMARDFTYIDDIVAGVLAALDRPPKDTPPHRIYNLGNHRPEKLLHYIEVLEHALGRKAVMEMVPMQPGDVAESFADIAASQRDLGFQPKTPIDVGIPNFVRWFKEYHGV